MPPRVLDLTGIKARYLAALPEHKRVFDDHVCAIRTVQQSDQAREHLTALQRVFHKIAGSAGILGFGEMGSAALQSESFIDTLLAAPSPATFSISGDLTETLAQFEAAIDKVLATAVG